MLISCVFDCFVLGLVGCFPLASFGWLLWWFGFMVNSSVSIISLVVDFIISSFELLSLI